MNDNNKPAFILDRLIGSVAVGFFVLYPHRSRRTRCLVVHKDNILLVYNRLNVRRNWTLPGGGLHKNETVSEGAAREVEEELSIKLNPARIAELGSHEEKRGLSKIIYELAWVSVENEKFTKNKTELLGAKWFPLDKLPENIHQVVHQAIKRANFKT